MQASGSEVIGYHKTYLLFCFLLRENNNIKLGVYREGRIRQELGEGKECDQNILYENEIINSCLQET